MAALDNILYVDSSSIAALFATGSLFGTASNAVSASWAPSAASGTTLTTGSTYQITSSWANNALTANTSTVAISASFASASIISNIAISSSFASASISSNIAISASFASASNTSISASYAVTASSAITASYFNGFPKFKAGVLATSSFSSSGGNPYTASITFTTPYPTAVYSVTVTGADARPWTVEQVSASNFTISTNSTQILTSNVYWQCMGVGESA